MNAITQFLRQFTRLFQWFVIVTPWEQALRVRAGKHVHVLEAGIHLTVPFIDVTYRQSVRLRLCTLQVQTLTTVDGKALTLSGCVEYSIADLSRLYGSLHHAEGSLQNMAMAEVAKFVSSSSSSDCRPAAIEDAVTERINFSRFGLAETRLRITDFAFVRTYRIINDAWRGSWADRLETTRAVGDPTE